jgi:hypothetical protein
MGRVFLNELRKALSIVNVVKFRRLYRAGHGIGWWHFVYMQKFGGETLL